MLAGTMLGSLAFLVAYVAGEASQGMDPWWAWSNGRASWKAARNITGGSRLWNEPNACDPVVLKSSAPLTALFGISTIWDRVQQRREANGRAGQPLELHVLGSSYPFEGRSDWSQLAFRRPEGVPKVRVTLVLGTPFQSDNVPPMAGQPNAFAQLDRKINPVAGKWSDNDEEIICKGAGKWGTKTVDEGWSKETLCRDHGNGLEVVCLEKFYQDVRETLTKPDMALMFSPGFPQMGRRSWDNVLVGILNEGVPLMISDVISLDSWGQRLKLPRGPKRTILPGGKWDPSLQIGEDWQTWLAMKKYGAYRAKARRSPFPILHAEDGGVLAKNAVVHIYQGYKPNKQPTLPLTTDDINKYDVAFKAIDWSKLGSRSCPGNELKRLFKFPTTKAFDNAVRDLYFEEYARKARKIRSSLNAEEVKKLQKYGLLPGSLDRKRKHWGLKGWVFVFETLGCSDF